jgi:outer membrane biosynthesis protein TonB
MRRMHRILMIVTIIAVAPALAGCADFDLDKLDVFGLSDKKKLPGDRKPLFPEGVPGVSQGIPPEYIKGNQSPPDTAQPVAVEPEKKAAAVEPVEEPKPKPKRKKPKAVASAPTKPVTTDQPAPAPQAAPWPAQPQQQPQQSSSAPWPSAPAPGTFSR